MRNLWDELTLVSWQIWNSRDATMIRFFFFFLSLWEAGEATKRFHLLSIQSNSCLWKATKIKTDLCCISYDSFCRNERQVGPNIVMTLNAKRLERRIRTFDSFKRDLMRLQAWRELNGRRCGKAPLFSGLIQARPLTWICIWAELIELLPAAF